MDLLILEILYLLDEYAKDYAAQSSEGDCRSLEYEFQANHLTITHGWASYEESYASAIVITFLSETHIEFNEVYEGYYCEGGEASGSFKDTFDNFEQLKEHLKLNI